MPREAPAASSTPTSRIVPRPVLAGLLAAAAFVFGAMLFVHLSYPLLWEDEGDSVIFGRSILRYGFPKVHDGPNVLYGLKEKLELGVDERTDAYTGAPWMNYYLGAIGVALAEGATDVHDKTFWLRFPYTVTGVFGLALLFVAILPGLRGRPGARQLSALAYLAMLSVSISLILHLREARYYPIVILLYGALLYAFAYRHFFARLSYGRYAFLTFTSLFLLFNTFYPAFGVWCAAASLFLFFRGWRQVQTAEGEGAGIVGRFWQAVRFTLWENAPVFAATAAVLPLLLFFDFVFQASRWFDQFDSSLAVYARNLEFVAHSMLRFEFGALVLGLKALLGIALWTRPDRRWPAGLEALRGLSAFLVVLLFAYAAIVTRSPFLFERYFLTMGPLVTLLVLVDARLLWRVLAAEGGVSVGWRRGLAAAAAIAVVASLAVRAPELGGRLTEMRTPYKGPLDYAVPYLLERYDRPEELVVATNYAEPVLMYYLGAHVIVGYYGANLEADLKLQPDVIVPRPWQQQYDSLETLFRRARYAPRAFEVKTQSTNNIPALSPYTPGGLVHRYETVLAENDRERFVIWERVPEPSNDGP